MEKMSGASKDLTRENIQKLKALFPEVFAEGKIDIDKLRLVLGDDVETKEERYSFTWHGKAQAMKLAQTPSLGTLCPDKQSSKNWDITKNLYFEGDNLEVLKLLQSAYFGKIKMIYIDPPYNTGKDFVYKDDFRDNIKNYKEITNQVKQTNTETSGRYHTDWLNMMYPRLKLAKNLLRRDGVIFISIDDTELTNLKKICDEIFGEESYIATISVVNNFSGRSDDKFIATANDYLLMYQGGGFETYGVPLPEEYFDQYTEVDDNGRYFRLQGLRKRGKGARRIDRPKMFYPFFVDPETQRVYLAKEKDDFIEVLPKLSDGTDGRWRWGVETAKQRLDLLAGRKVTGRDEWDVFEIDYADIDGNLKTIKPKSLWIGSEFSSDTGTRNYKELMRGIDFTSPKPTYLIKYCLAQSTSSNDIVLDFFSGSATTADAVMQQNADDGGNRRFILVQLPEPTDDPVYTNICEIGKERIRRAGGKITQEVDNCQVDVGFKVFKLDSSNLKLWNPDYDNLEDHLFNMQNNLVDGRCQEDLLYEILLKQGIDITIDIKEVDINGKKMFDVGLGALLIFLENNVLLDDVNELVKCKSEFMDTKVVFRDSGFADDTVKTNAIQILKQAGIKEDHIRSV